VTFLNPKESFLLKNQSFASIPRRLNDIARLYLLLAATGKFEAIVFDIRPSTANEEFV